MREEILSFLDHSNTYEVRGLRLLLEYFFANERFREFYSCDLVPVSVFGSARVRESDAVYQDALRLGRLLYESGYSVITGASNGVMEAANKGVSDAVIERLSLQGEAWDMDRITGNPLYREEMARHSIGLKINLPFEREANPYLGNVVSFHYFAIRKFYFAMLARAFIRMRGGWGTRDEFWEINTLVQTGKSPLMPIIVLGEPEVSAEIERNINEGYASEFDRYLIDFVETPEEAVEIIRGFYGNIHHIKYTREWEIQIYTKREPPPAICESMSNYLSKHPGVFSGIEFEQDRILLKNFTFKSFGHLRRLVDALNGLERF
jgi:hypothetical protein